MTHGMELQRATLVCVPDEGFDTNLRVVGLELPAAPVLVGGAALKNTVEVELQWPGGMVDTLTDFYDRNFASRPADFQYEYDDSTKIWNCHTFGALVTGNMSTLQLSSYYHVKNAEPGNIVKPNNVENAELCGYFGRYSKPSHTVVTTQAPGQYMNIQGLYGNLYYSDSEGLKKHYANDGEFRAYTLGATSAGLRSRSRVPTLIRQAYQVTRQKLSGAGGKITA